MKENVWDSAEGVLVANKIDQVEEQIVQSADARRLAEQHGLTFVETSARDDMRVGEALSLFSILLHFH